MIDVIDILNYILMGIMVIVSGVWIYLVKSMLDSFAKAPHLDKFDVNKHDNPQVSVIVPARNEEKYIGKCLESLVHQEYTNYNVIAIDDSSEDKTGEIISEYAKKYPSKIIHVKAKPKPDGWMGKNWACMQGYDKSTAELLLFTDSDTTHSKNIISLAVSHLMSCKLDALTVIPKMLCPDFWTRITVPMISIFLHTRFSVLKVNDPTKKTGYFFGSFFIIKKTVYDMVGTHKGVRQEIIEDGALGRKVKDAGFKLKMVRGEKYVDAIWARDMATLWQALKRLMIPLYLQSGKGVATGIFFAVLFLMFISFPLLAYSGILSSLYVDAAPYSYMGLFLVCVVSSILSFVAGFIEVRHLEVGIKYAVMSPIGSLVIILGFFSGLVHAGGNDSVSWRGRTYSKKDHSQNPLSV
jgi:cellulose synthase/poly-beta-1,6-N-acetylglucosamine synthase-like glycosyltransferase